MGGIDTTKSRLRIATVLARMIQCVEVAKLARAWAFVASDPISGEIVYETVTTFLDAAKFVSYGCRELKTDRTAFS